METTVSLLGSCKERQRLTRQRCGTLQTNIGKLAKHGGEKEVSSQERVVDMVQGLETADFEIEHSDESRLQCRGIETKKEAIKWY